MIEKRLVCIGKVAKVHGVKGELKLVAYSGDAAGLCGYQEFYLAAEQTAVAAGERRKGTDGATIFPGWHRVSRCRAQGKFTLVALDGIEQREAAQALVGLLVHVDEKALAPLAEDEFYWRELEGLSVVSADGQEVGKVSSLFSTGAHDVLVVTGGAREYYIPATKEFIAGIDSVAKKLTVVLIPGLLEMNN